MRKLSRRATNIGCALAMVIGSGFAASVVFPEQAWAQNVPDDHRLGSRSGKAISRADQEAEQKVSLSADKIIEVLRREPGLLLEVKKALVRRAYEQGRILDSADLTDEALFRLLRDDESVCNLATREIEDRYYVRAKPTREELEEQRSSAAEQGLVRTTSAKASSSDRVPSGSAKATSSQEESYWDNHERDYGTPNQAPRSNPATPSYSPSGPTPVPFPPDSRPENPARAVERASLQENEQAFDNLNSETSEMARIRPEELPGLLKVDSRGPFAARDSVGAIPSNNIPTPRSATAATDRTPPLPQQARLENPRPPMPLLSDRNEDRPLIRHRPNPYANVPSLYDLYAQVSRRPAVLERFGLEVFRNGTGNTDDLPMDLPAGPDYVLGSGDGLSIELWGGIAQRLQRVVDREGRVALPEVGAVEVSGRSLGEVQRLVQSVLRSQFRDIEADVSLTRIRSVRVYVVGDVNNPGAYDISSLSTPLNALYAAGGPTSRGSLRHLRHYRGKQLVEEIDAYDLLLHGIHGELARIQSGDTILVPPVGAEVTVEGMVRRPAIYELDREKALAEVLELAGGVLPSGTLRHVDVERLLVHEKRTMLRLDLPEGNDQQAVNQALDQFQIQDGDQVKISPILPYADQTVYVDGHVFHPGKYPYRDGMKITDVLHSYSDLLPEPSRRHAEIIRLQPPDYTPVVLAFNLGDAMAGNDQNLVLRPFDTVRVFARYDFEDPPVITVSGEVRDPGDHITNGLTHLRDAVYLAGGVSSEAELDNAQVFRKTQDNTLKVISVNLSRALSGDPKDDILLEPKDRVFIHRSQTKVDPPTVVIQGQVVRPGKYPLGDGLSAASLVRLAGGLKRGAYTQSADLIRYLVQDEKKVLGERMTVAIAAAMAEQPDTDVRLRDGDVLTIGELAGWNDVGATITVNGEVVHPGTYGIREGEHLSSILERAGGLRADAYAYGAIFERSQVRELEEKNRAALIRRVQGEQTELKLATDTEPDQKAAKEASLLQWQATLERLENTPPVGRLVIRISSDIQRWANSPADIQVRAGDVIYIPKKPNFIMVDGAVYNPTAVSFRPGKSAGWYLSQAGGPTNVANKKAIFVIRANGSVISDSSGGWLTGGLQSAALQPGDMVVVPEKAFGGSTKWKNTLQASQLVSSVGIAVQVARAF